MSISSVQFSCSVMFCSLWPYELRHARPPYPSPTPGVYPNSCPLSLQCNPAISSSVILFSSCPQSLPASGSFPMSQLFTWGGQSIGVSASSSILPMNTQDWSPLRWAGWTSLQVKTNFMLRIHDIPGILLNYSCEIPGMLTILTTFGQKPPWDTWALALIIPPLWLVFKFSGLQSISRKHFNKLLVFRKLEY